MNILKAIGMLVLLTSVTSFLTGCATRKMGASVLPQGGASMAAIYDHQYDLDKSTQALNRVRNKVNVSQHQDNEPMTLPNPVITLYVYPHFDGQDQNYVPGHRAYTQFYKETHFALPGEATSIG